MEFKTISVDDIPSKATAWTRYSPDLLCALKSLKSDEAIEVVLDKDDPKTSSFCGHFKYHADSVKGFKCITREGVPYIVRTG
jgi:hypothetical protein